MKFHQSIFQNNNLTIFKYLTLITLISLLSFKANTEIPEKYKIETSLPKCVGDDYKKWTNCYGKLELPRIEYKGEWKDGKLHGKGILKEAWGAIYIGDFKNNMADGNGRQEEPNGIWREGEFKNDKFTGKGILYEAESKCRHEGIWIDFKMNGPGKIECEDGGFSEGNFKNDLFNGQGFLKYANGDEYSGEWKDGMLHGKGEKKFSDGHIERGIFVDDKLNGQGFLKSIHGNEYSGEFVDGALNGKGEIKMSNGSIERGIFVDDYLEGEGFWSNKIGEKYYGQFKKSKFQGKGKYIYISGNIFEGEFNEDFKIYGTFNYTNGDKYIGQFKNHKFHGNGKFIYSNGNKYEGEWKNGIEQGKGIFTWYNGDKYEGDFFDGYRTGQGKYIYESGTVYEGDFFENYAKGNGKFIYSNGNIYVGEVNEGYEHGQGRMEYENGDIYEGQWKEGYMHGQGKLFYANGDISEGIWDDGKKAPGKTTLAKFTTDEKYYALIIGNNDYENEKLEDLDNAVNDAKDLEKVLKEKYGFETKLLIDKKSNETEDAIIEFTENRDKNDNILIYYAGHGQRIKKQKLERGYWLPTDAGATRDSKWISNGSIKDYIGSSAAKHILLIVDSCFAGSLTRGSGEAQSLEKLNKTSIERLSEKFARLVITSGGNERVADGIGEAKNSVFAEPLIKTLKNNNDVIRSIELFQRVQKYVLDNADQSPEYALIHGTGHEGGEFLFFPKN